MTAPNLFVVMGPTSSGKSVVAERIAKDIGAPIINADAFQIYRGMNIGTAKPKDVQSYQLLDIRNPDQEFGVGEFVQLASDLLHTYFDEGQSVVLVGGTGLYVRALLEEYSDLLPSPPPEERARIMKMKIDDVIQELTSIAPETVSKLDLKNEVRVRRALEKRVCQLDPIDFSVPAFHITKFGIIPTPETSHDKIKQRTIEMFQNGWVAEVKELLSQGYRPENPGFRALGYRAIAQHIQEIGNEVDLIERIENDTVKYAKRQRTWLRAEPNLIVYSEISEAYDAVAPLLLK
jgi:tRNA dimethylallyltransferase